MIDDVMTENERLDVIARIRVELGDIEQRIPELRSVISGGEAYSDDSMIASRNEANATAMMEIGRLTHRKVALVEALKKANDIGICEDCGNDVPYKRYIINPATTLCTSCQEIREIKSKHVRQAA
ncbi:TPA: TraR/DksA C4-type zinc finger protein [Aeromonas hydrophila subsp. hydrophila]